MAAAPKREWVRPRAHPITTADSRADVPDIAARNLVTPISDAP